MKISGCIIARNEEQNIAKCINNLKSVTDEIIVVDTGSDDGTVRIASGLGAQVYCHKWENDFSQAKNAALRHAKGDWIIFLDADEFFSDESLPLVRQAIETTHPHTQADGMLCDMAHIDQETGQVIGRNAILRIFRNHRGFLYINKVHEDIRNNGEPLQCADVGGDLVILHTGYSPSMLQKKVKRNLDYLLAGEQDELHAYYLANSYSVLKEYQNARRFAEQALASNAVTSRDHFAYQMHLVRIDALMQEEHTDDSAIQRAIVEANQKFREYPEIARVEANYLLSKKRYTKALEKYRYALDCHEKYGAKLQYNNFQRYIHDVYCRIADILYVLNLDGDALDYYVRALNSQKYSGEALKGLLKLTRTIPETEVIVFINSLYPVNSEDDMRFVISQIADCGRAKIVLYYARLWNNSFGHADDALIYAFIAQREYAQAFRIAQVCMKGKPAFIPLAVSVLIMGSLFAEAEAVRDDIGAEYYEIIACFAEERVITGNAYMAVLTQLVHFAEQYDISRYLSLRPPGAGHAWRIARILLSECRYELALEHYAALAESETADQAAAAFYCGYCLYKLRDYRRSLDWFLKAIQRGYGQNDLPEYLRAIAQLTDDAGIKAAAGDALAGWPE